MLPTTTTYSSKLTDQPSTKYGSPGRFGTYGKPLIPSVSPLNVTPIVFGVFGAVSLNPGS